jgi:glycogen(starch) synthase
MRILHVIDRYWPAPGGAERHLQEYAERQAAEGHDVVVFTTDAFELEYFWDSRKRRIDRGADHHNGVRVERFAVEHLPPDRISFRALRRLLNAVDSVPGATPLQRRLARLSPPVPGLESALRQCKGRFDVVHGMNLTFDALLRPALRHARAAGVPFLVSPLIHLGESSRSWVRRNYTMRHQLELLRQADVVFTQTPTEIAFLAERGVDPERMVPAGAGVDPARAAGGDGGRFRARHGLSGPIVCSAGTMHRDKGTFDVVRAMERLWARGSGATLVLIGEATDPFRRFLDDRPPTTRARMRVLGYVPDEEKRDLLAAADVFALPSRTDSFGIVFLEAWLNGCPVVAAAAGGVPDVVEDGRSGLVVPFGDVGAIAGAIERLLTDRALARRLAAHGAAATRERYTWDHVYDRVRPWFASTMRGTA